MKKILLFALACVVGVGFADAAVRDTNSVNRKSNNAVVSRTANTARNTNARKTVSRTNNQRATTNRTTAARTATQSRAAAARTSTARSATSTKRTGTQSVARAATRPSRAATTTAVTTQTFGSGYNTCRDAYFTCMDQFCANANESYRRCVCSSKLSMVQSREKALGQTADQLQNFQDLNIAVIDKTSAEVTAMLSASEGEYTASISKDKSAAAQQLAGISAVLSETKSKALSTQGTLDIAGDINAIWATTDLAGGTNIANLVGEPLYNAVHAQCAELVAPNCESTSTLNMVVSAYGMYIENDCTTLLNALDKNYNSAKGSIRNAEREMNIARLENYDAHNSSSITECIAMVRQDVTADTACGTDFVHCLDVSGLYLNRDTGEPIYTSNFYQLELMTSLSGDVLNNQTNRILVAELNKKRAFAEQSLDTCRDLADDVWDEFMRQAISEIYQGQQARVRQVKDECLDVVNKCYDTQRQSLKDFSNINEQLLLGQRLELSEEMCQEKLNACSNLYGGGTAGMQELLTTMHDITDQTIAKDCKVTLLDYVDELCAVPSNDSLHSRPFACRVYAPGEQRYAAIQQCNLLTNLDITEFEVSQGTVIPNIDIEAPGDNDDDSGGGTTPGYSCPAYKKYTSCNEGYFLYATAADGTTLSGTDAVVVGNNCVPCETYFEQNKDKFTSCTCAGGTAAPQCTEVPKPDDEPEEELDEEDVKKICGEDYVGSLYHKLARYAMQACVRPSESTEPLPATVLQDINQVMSQVRVQMSTELSKECERLGGTWVDTIWVDEIDKGECTNNQCIPDVDGADGIHDITGDAMLKKFYTETSANTKWGYCADTN